MAWLKEFPALGSDTLGEIRRSVDGAFRGFTREHGEMMERLFDPLREILRVSELLITQSPWPLVVLGLVWQVPDGAVWQLRFLDHTITPLQGDKLSRLFATIFAIMAVGGGLFALGQKSRLEVPAAFVYAGSAIGVALAGDLITVFAFWELMAVGSTLVLWSQGSEASYRAARRYAMVHLLGGVILFAGVTGHVVQTGSVAFTHMEANSIAHWLILIGGFLLLIASRFYLDIRVYGISL